MGLFGGIFGSIRNLLGIGSKPKSIGGGGETEIKVEVDADELIDVLDRTLSYYSYQPVEFSFLDAIGRDAVNEIREKLEIIRASGDLIESFGYQIVEHREQGSVSITTDDPAAYALDLNAFGKPPYTRIQEWMEFIPEFQALTPVEFRQAAFLITRKIRENPQQLPSGTKSRLYDLPPLGDRAYEFIADVQDRMMERVNAAMDAKFSGDPYRR